MPVAAGDDPNIWSDATYGKGSLGFLAIRQKIGAAAFETALHDLATRYAWGEMTPDDLRAAFETASGQDLDALWSHWFDEAAMTHEGDRGDRRGVCGIAREAGEPRRPLTFDDELQPKPAYDALASALERGRLTAIPCGRCNKLPALDRLSY